MAIISKIWSQSALELDLSLRYHVLDAVPGARARTGVRPRTPRALVRALPSVVLARAYKSSPGAPHLTPCSPSPARRSSLSPTSSFRPPLPLKPRPPWPAHSSCFPAAPAARLASPRAREASQALGPGRTSPESQDRPRRTLVARLRA
jgi:hypothetical protein